MNYKFKPRTALVVAGLVAATYAEACYYAQTATTTVCFSSGTTIDRMYWPNNVGFEPIIATADWNQGKQNGTVGYLTSASTTVVQGQGYASASGLDTTPTYCYGPAKFLDPTSHYQTVSYWENNILYGGGAAIPNPPAPGWHWGAVSGSTCP
jgi:hypothetical protein